jgi:pimeloyl-ACP methyl ester carboxylesterase
MLRRLLLWAVPVAVLVAGALAAAYWSGRQEPIDVVAETERRLGVDLESHMVPGSGILLHVVLAGPKDGPPVVLLHGFPEFWWAWNEQIAHLARAGFRVIAPDQRGYNGSDKPTAIEDYQVELLVADVIALILRLRYESVYLAGHDWGGAIAWHLVIAHPERVRRLVMFNSPHPLAWMDAQSREAEEETISWYRTFFQLPWLPELLARAGNWWLLEKNLRDTSRPGTFSGRDLAYYKYAWDRDGAMHSMINWYRAGFRYPPRVDGDGTVRVPTRIVWGMKDRYLESRLARLSAEHCADATLVEMPDAGHWLLHEEPQATSRQMIEFFAAEPAGNTVP